MADSRILTPHGGHGERASHGAFNDPGRRLTLGGGHGDDSYRSYLPRQVGRMLARARHRRGWSVREAARRSGISRGMVGDLETGRRAPSWPLAMDLAEAYGLEPADAAELLRHAVVGAGRDSPYRQG